MRVELLHHRADDARAEHREEDLDEEEHRDEREGPGERRLEPRSRE